jgi:hypothetical protein
MASKMKKPGKARPFHANPERNQRLPARRLSPRPRRATLTNANAPGSGTVGGASTPNAVRLELHATWALPVQEPLEPAQEPLSVKEPRNEVASLPPTPSSTAPLIV